VLFAIKTVCLFEAKKLPINGDVVLGSHIANPQRCLMGPWAHRVKIEVNC